MLPGNNDSDERFSGLTSITTTTIRSQTMNQDAKHCAECTPNCRVEIAETRLAALSRYWDLFKQGLFPSMCQQKSGQFHVCYVENQDK
jgi:hypothetical protein